MEANGRTKAWLLGVQPKSLKAGEPLTPTLQKTLETLAEVLRGMSLHSEPTRQRKEQAFPTEVHS